MATRSTKGSKRQKAEAGILHCGINAAASYADISQVDWSLFNGVNGVSGNGATSTKAGTAIERIRTAAPNIHTRKLTMLPLLRLSRSAPKNPDTQPKGGPVDDKPPISTSDDLAYTSTLNVTGPYQPPTGPLSGYTGSATKAGVQQSVDGTPFISENSFAYGSAPTATQPSATAGQSYPVIRVIRGTPGDAERMDKSFCVRKSSFFRIGSVFDILRDDSSLSFEDGPQDSDYEEERVRDMYLKIRRFTVIKYIPKEGHMICLPVSTYGGRGYKQHGIHLKEHGFIYVDNKKLQQVGGMNLVPIKVKLSRESLQFSDPSLINYTKLYTVELNVNVREFGVLDSKSQELLARNFDIANSPEGEQGKQGWGSYIAKISALLLAGAAGGIVQRYAGGGGADERPSNDDLDRGHHSPTERYPPSRSYSRSSQQASENSHGAYPSSSTNYYTPSNRPSRDHHPGYSDYDNVDPSVISPYTPSASQITGSGPSTYVSAHNVPRQYYSAQVDYQAGPGYSSSTATSVDFSSTTQVTYEAISTRASTSYTQMIWIYKQMDDRPAMAGNVLLDSGNEGYNLVASSVVESLELEPTDDTATVTTYNGEESTVGGEVKITFSGAFREDGDQRYYTEKFRVVDEIQGGPDMLLNQRFMKKHCAPPGTLYMRARVGKKLSKEDKAKKKAQEDKKKQEADKRAAASAAQREADRDAEHTGMNQNEAETASHLAALNLSDEINDGSKGKQKEVAATDVNESTGGTETNEYR